MVVHLFLSSGPQALGNDVNTTEETGCTEVLGVTNEECHQLFAMSAMMSVFFTLFFFVPYRQSL